MALYYIIAGLVGAMDFYLLWEYNRVLHDEGQKGRLPLVPKEIRNPWKVLQSGLNGFIEALPFRRHAIASSDRRHA